MQSITALSFSDGACVATCTHALGTDVSKRIYFSFSIPVEKRTNTNQKWDSLEWALSALSFPAKKHGQHIHTCSCWRGRTVRCLFIRSDENQRRNLFCVTVKALSRHNQVHFIHGTHLDGSRFIFLKHPPESSFGRARLFTELSSTRWMNKRWLCWQATMRQPKPNCYGNMELVLPFWWQQMLDELITI